MEAPALETQLMDANSFGSAVTPSPNFKPVLFLAQTSQFVPALDRHRNMLNCIPCGLVHCWTQQYFCN